jgi:hypothetical protein
MASDPNYIPLPIRPTGELPELDTETIDGGWRVHWEVDPVRPPKYPSGRWRFDAPTSEYQVTYVNQDEHAVFAEVYGDDREISPRNLTRRVSTASSTRSLHLVALEDPQVLAAFHLDLRISAAVNYPRTMQWSLAFHNWYPKADGVRYLGRHATIHLNYGLFLDRCGDVLNFDLEGDFASLRPKVTVACDLYSLAPRLYDPIPPSGWL